MADHGSHARHDRFAIADAIGGGLLPATLGTCPACGALHGDLLTLQRSIREAWVPRRSRNLHLSLTDADRLRRRGWQRLVAAIGSQGDVITRPLALSFTGLGLAGLLLSTVPSVLPFASAGAAPYEISRTTVHAAPGAAMAPPTDAPITDVADAPGTPAPASALPGVSIGLLGMGAAILLVRRVARGVDGMR